MNSIVIQGLLVDEHTTFSFIEVCQKCDISEDQLLEFIEHGLCNHAVSFTKDMRFAATTLKRIQAAHRLQQDLEINTSGVMVVLELLEELDNMRNELNMLRRHIYP